MRIIFLDFDGVLNSKEYKKQYQYEVGSEFLDPEAISRLNQIVLSTGAKVVVTSSWRFAYLNNFDGLCQLLERYGFTGEVIGMTSVLGTREKEIWNWLDLHDDKVIDSFVVIDDEDVFQGLKPYLIQTTKEHGLQDEHVFVAIKKLLS